MVVARMTARSLADVAPAERRTQRVAALRD